MFSIGNELDVNPVNPNLHASKVRKELDFSSYFDRLVTKKIRIDVVL